MNTSNRNAGSITPAALLTVSEVAESLNLSNASVFTMIRQGALLANRLGRRKGAIRIRPDDLNACLESAEQPPVARKPKPRAPRMKLRHIRLQ